MPFIAVQKRPATVVSLFATSHGAPSTMPETNRNLTADRNAIQTVPANLDNTIALDAALIRGLLGWKTATLRDGRVVCEVLLDVPGGASERCQIVLHRSVADEVGKDLRDLATALHIEPS